MTTTWTGGWRRTWATGLPCSGAAGYTGTSALGLRLSGGSRETVLGWRLSESRNSGLMFSLDVEGRRSEISVGEPEHSFGVLMTTRW